MPIFLDSVVAIVDGVVYLTFCMPVNMYYKPFRKWIQRGCPIIQTARKIQIYSDFKNSFTSSMMLIEVSQRSRWQSIVDSFTYGDVCVNVKVMLSEDELNEFYKISFK